MENKYKVYLICDYNGRPLDFLLPVYTEDEFADIEEVAGNCFIIHEPKNAEITLGYYVHGTFETIRVNIEKACRKNANISFCIVINEKEKKASLRAYTDSQHNAFFPIPAEFTEQSYNVSHE